FAKGRRAAVGDGHRCQRSIGLETPAVVEAGHAGSMSAAVVDHLGAAMRAAVEQNMYLSAAIARHHHRLTAKFSGEVIAGVWHLAGMAHKKPSAAKHALHLEFENFGVRVNAAMHASRLD